MAQTVPFKTYKKELPIVGGPLLSVRKVSEKLIVTIDVSDAVTGNYITFDGTSPIWADLPAPPAPQGFTLAYNLSGAIERIIFDDQTETVLTYDNEGSITQVQTPTSTKVLNYSPDGTLLGVSIL